MQIERGIEIPEVVGRSPGRKPKYPFADMEVGDSFSVHLNKKGDKVEAKKVAVRLSVSVAYYQRNYGGRFTTRTMLDEGVVRCWKVA
jgi:hypothetical protein